MTKSEEKILLEKYYRGETSLEEEAMLFRFAKTSDGLEMKERIPFEYYEQKRREEPSPTLAENLIRILAEPGHASPKQVYLPWILRIAAVLVLAVGVGWFLLKTTSPSTRTYTTSSGEQQHVVLPDNTQVWLNENSELKYDIFSFNKHERSLTLTGEAYFDVAHDRNKPFVIYTGDVTTKVVGTMFNLRNYTYEETIELNLTAGNVEFGADKKNILHPGQQATFHSIQQYLDIGVLSSNADSWKTQRLIFNDTPVRDVIHDLERHFHIRIESQNPALLTCHFTGEFKNPTLRDVLEVLRYSLHIEYTQQHETYLLSGSACFTP